MADLAEARAEERLRNKIRISEDSIVTCHDWLTEPDLSEEDRASITRMIGSFTVKINNLRTELEQMIRQHALRHRGFTGLQVKTLFLD
jgi:hypothetical protein